MTGERFLRDTVFIQALLNKRDPYYPQAIAFLPRVEAAREVWVTEAVLVEVGNALSAINRALAAEFIEQCYSTSSMRVQSIDTPLLNQALALYGSRPDKTWSLTDCISFVVMEQQGITEAVTADRHFTQAGYHTLLSTETR